MLAQGCINPGNRTENDFLALKGFVRVERFQRLIFFRLTSQGCRSAPTAGLTLANASGVQLDWTIVRVAHAAQLLLVVHRNVRMLLSTCVS